MTWLTIVAVLLPQQANDFPPLPSLNSWELSHRLRMEREFQLALEVTPNQLERLAELHRDERFLPILTQKMDELSKANPNLGTSGLISLAWHAHEDLVRKEFSAILAPEQLDAIRDWPMRQRFPSGLQPFLDFELLQACGVEEAEIREIRDEALEIGQTMHSELLRIRKKGAVKLIDMLDGESRELFGVYVGNSIVPINPRQTDVPFDQIPFPGRSLSVGAFTRLIGYPVLQKRLALTDKQLAELKGLDDEFSNRLSAHGSLPQPISFHEYFQSNSKRIYELMKAVLTAEQNLKLAQILTAEDFCFQYKGPFLEPSSARFFKLSKKTYEALLEECDAQERLAAREVARFHEETFGKLLAKVSEDAAREQLGRLFDGFWDTEP